MVGLLNYITFLLAFHVTYSEDNSTILFCNGINGGFCSKVLQPVEPFNSSKVAILDNKLSSVTCPPDGMKLVLFECTSWDRCDCNTTLEVYEQCFGNKLFCNELVTSYSTFTYKCNKELQLYCPSHTISTYKSTSRKSSTSTTTISSSDHFRNTTSKQTSRQTSQSTKTKISTTLTTISKELTTVSKESLPTHIPEPKYPKEEQKTKDAVNAVVIFSILCVVGATGGICFYKNRRRRSSQIQKEHGNDMTPPNGTFTYTDENHEHGGNTKNNTHELQCQQSCDSGVVCNVEINHYE